MFFCTSKNNAEAASGQVGGSGMKMLSIVFVVSGVVYSGSMMMHFLGQASTQFPHCTHCILSMTHVLSFLFTVIASDGHFLAHILQRMQPVSSIHTLPLVFSYHCLGTSGYIRVAGFFSKLFNTNFVIL